VPTGWRGRRVPRVTSSAVASRLAWAALAAKVLLSVFVDETLGTWVAVALGLASTVTFSMWAWHASHPEAGASGDQPDARPPPLPPA
jgi:hypothetical protein